MARRSKSKKDPEAAAAAPVATEQRPEKSSAVTAPSAVAERPTDAVKKRRNRKRKRGRGKKGKTEKDDDESSDSSSSSSSDESDSDSDSDGENEQSQKRKKESQLEEGMEKQNEAGSSAATNGAKLSVQVTVSSSLEVRDPLSDTALPETAQQALHYAYQFWKSRLPGSSEAWKFNKAKQNWLLRHFWSQESIPSEYVDLVLEYLKTVQGRAREELARKSRDVATAPTSHAEAEITEQVGATEEAQPSSLHPTENAEPSVKVDQEGEEDKTEESGANAEERKRRAEKLLEALG